MIVHATATCLTLMPGRLARLHLRAGTRLRGVRGSAWLTADGDRRDIVLEADEEWVLDRDRELLACALQGGGQVVLQLDERPETRA
jgi:hypothetical protein